MKIINTIKNPNLIKLVPLNEVLKDSNEYVNSKIM